MKLNKEKFMKTEMGGELEETIRTWDKAIDERRKATPGIGNPDQGLGFKYWTTLAEAVRTDGKCSNWQSSSFMELNFSSQEQMNTSECAARMRASGS